MTIFTKDDEGRLDWSLLQHGSVTLYSQEQYLDRDVQLLQGQGYMVVDLDCSKYIAIPELLKAMGQRLEFPDFFRGNSLDAFDDHLYDIQIPNIGGVVIVLYRYNLIVKPEPRQGWQILNILDNHSRLSSLYGLRFITLVHTADPKIQLAPVGSQNVKWNQKEWLDAQKGL